MPKTVIVVGGGTTGAVACGLLATFPPLKKWKIINIRSSKIPNIGVGESTTPLLMSALQYMGIAKEFVDQTNCWPKYGAIFKGWSNKNLIVGWSINGHRNDVVTYLEGLTRNKIIPRSSEYVYKGLYPYDIDTDSFYSPVTLHLDANQTAEFIFNKFRNRITTIHGDITDVKIGPDGIQEVRLDNGIVRGSKNTYWVDASGFKRILINAFGTKFIKSELPCNGAVFKKIEDVPYEQNWSRRITDMMTISTTGNAGWFWHIPLKRGRGRGYVYSRDFLSEEDAAREFGGGEVSFLRYEPGWLETPAIKNCYAIGLSAGFLDALDSPSIAQTVVQIFRFMKKLKNPDSQVYSKNTTNAYKKLNDYLLLHYKTSKRVGPFWDSIEKFTEKQLLDQYVNIISDDWDDNFDGSDQKFILSQSSRVIQNRIDMSDEVASLIYETISEKERLSIREDYNRVKNKCVPWTKDIFMKHMEYGNERAFMEI